MANAVTGQMRGTGNWRTSAKGGRIIRPVGSTKPFSGAIDPAEVIAPPKGQRRKDAARRAEARAEIKAERKRRRKPKHRRKHRENELQSNVKFCRENALV